MNRWAVLAGTPLIAAVVAVGPAAPAVSAPPGSPAQIHQLVVKVSDSAGCTIDLLAGKYHLAVDDQLMASRRIFRAHSTIGQFAASQAEVQKLTNKMSSDSCVVYAEPDAAIALADEQFHSWAPGSAYDATSDDWETQSARTQLDLADVHETDTGLDATVAVLDTGADAGQPVLVGHLLPGHDYVDDDDDPADLASGSDSDLDGDLDSAVGHGTFVSGMVAMVAPDARILPLRVLDSDGNGTVFTVAEAVYDSIAAGADVINMSFGSNDNAGSKVLDQALKAATKQGVVVVAAAGNDADEAPRYPAAVGGVWAVAATNPSTSTLAGYSNQGPWVDVATVGTDLVGPLPGGRFGRWSGTSFAAPLVAGQFALLRSAQPGEDDKAVVDAVNHTCVKLAHTGLRAGVVDMASSLTWLSDH